MTNFRQERRELKQQLFRIRRYIEGENVKLDEGLRKLKKEYEENPRFTCWSDFPEKWDIGDPHSVKRGSWGNETDLENFTRAFDKPYTAIIIKKVERVELPETTITLEQTEET